MKTDTLPTGEQQARLPGDAGDVRDLEIRLAPVAELPFTLTPPPNPQGSFQADLWFGPGDFTRKTGGR